MRCVGRSQSLLTRGRVVAPRRLCEVSLHPSPVLGATLRDGLDGTHGKQAKGMSQKSGTSTTDSMPRTEGSFALSTAAASGPHGLSLGGESSRNSAPYRRFLRRDPTLSVAVS